MGNGRSTVSVRVAPPRKRTWAVIWSALIRVTSSMSSRSIRFLSRAYSRGSFQTVENRWPARGLSGALLPQLGGAAAPYAAHSLPALRCERAVSRSTRPPGCPPPGDGRDRRSCIAGVLTPPRTVRAPPVGDAARRFRPNALPLPVRRQVPPPGSAAVLTQASDRSPPDPQGCPAHAGTLSRLGGPRLPGRRK